MDAQGCRPPAQLDSRRRHDRLAAGSVTQGRERFRARAGVGPGYPVALEDVLRADLGAVESAVSGRDAVLLDSRTADFFEGRAKSPQAARPGRLPGALQLDHALAFDKAAQKLRSPAELERLFAAIPRQPVINYCNTGHQAATNWFILSELLGWPNVSLYDGSLSEWTQDPGRPVAAGAAEVASDGA